MKRQTDSGAALISAVLVMMLMSAVLVGFIALVVSDQQSLTSGNDQTKAYVSAHAGLEKLTADLAGLFRSNFSPTGAQVNTLTDSSHLPNLSGITFVKPSGQPGYVITFTADASGNPQVENPLGSNITEGPYQGLIGLITPYTMDVTARTRTNAEVRLTRTVQAVAIPVFQFGIFSDNDLSFHAGPDFNFGGRVHTNQNLYLAQGPNTTLVMGDRVTAVGEVVRTHLANGRDINDSGHTGTVRIATQADGCNNTSSATCRVLQWASATNHEGSVNIGSAGGLGIVPPSTLQVVNGQKLMVRANGNSKNTGSTTSPWATVTTEYGGFLENGVYKNVSGVYSPDGTTTPARRLELPIVDTDTGAEPRDLIKRPLAGDATGPGTTFDQRFFRLASLRILLSDNAADITSLPTVTSGAPVDLSQLDAAGNPYSYVVDATHPPIAKTAAAGTTGMLGNKPTITGWVKIERQDNAGAWTDVTMEILNLGFAGRNLSSGTANVPVDPGPGACLDRSPSAVIRFERISDTPQGGGTYDNCGKTGAGVWTNTASSYIPMALYDAREGALNESDTGGGTIRLSGVMHYVELDVKNFKRWIAGSIGSTGSSNTMNVTGYVVYFSDRRGNKNPALTTTSKETGELGWEDFLNNNTTFDTGEDVNADGVQQMYGNTVVPPANSQGYLTNTGTNLRTTVDITNARTNPPGFFRRALKIVDGGLGDLPANGLQGLTVASENPVYVEGNFNACGTPYFDCGTTTDGFANDTTTTFHVSAAVIADAVTLLSRRFNDIRSFLKPHDVTGSDNNSRWARSSWYRLAIISGKGLNFPWDGSTEADRGTDGGVHNFLRYIEDWGDPDGSGALTGSTLNYRGSMVSLYINREAVGTFKCCGNVYSPPTRAYHFDTDFLTPSLLPPRTPMFRDINVLTFRESWRPTEP